MPNCKAVVSLLERRGINIPCFEGEDMTSNAALLLGLVLLIPVLLCADTFEGTLTINVKAKTKNIVEFFIVRCYWSYLNNRYFDA